MANEIQQPKPFDLVGDPILVGGIGSGFEATLQFRVHDGHDERTGHFTVGGGTGEHGQFQFPVDVSGAAFQLDRPFVEVSRRARRTDRKLTRSSFQSFSARALCPAISAFGCMSSGAATRSRRSHRPTTAIPAASATSSGQIRLSSATPTGFSPARRSRYRYTD